MGKVKSYTDLEQSKKLAEILKVETADMCFTNNSISIKINAIPYIDRTQMWEGYTEVIPCWSLAALLNVLSSYELNNFGNVIQLSVKNEALETEDDETLLDLVVNMIIHLHELKKL